MKAAFIETFGGSDQIKYGDIPDPKPGPGQVLVEVHASSLNPVDFKLRSGAFKLLSGKKFPKIFGADFSGVVVGLGDGVEMFNKGDAVFGGSNVLRGGHGSNAELIVTSEKNLTIKPDVVSYEEAAAIPVAGLTAYQTIKQVNIYTAQPVLVNGASGGVGIFALQCAKIKGAHVTAVCSTQSVEFVKSLGADFVLDYYKEDPTKINKKYDLFFDAYGKRKFGDIKSILNNGGIFISTLPTLRLISRLFWNRFFANKKIILPRIKYSHDDLGKLAEWVREGKIKIPVHKTFALNEVNLAHAMLERGGVKGKIIIKIK